MDKFLNQFVAVADAGSITRAATSLLLSQPTLTSNMQRLEESIGAPLFTRTSRGIQLTQYGEILYHNTQLMRRLYDNTLDAIALHQGKNEHSLSIGTGYSWWNLFFCDMVVEYAEKYPQAPIHVSIGNQLRCMDQLLSNDIALFMAHEIDGLSRSTGARFIPLGRVGLGYYVREGHPLLQKPRTIIEIERYPFVTNSSPEARHQRFLEAWSPLASSGISNEKVNYAFASNSLAACIDFVQRTDAVYAMTILIEGETRPKRLTRVEMSEATRVSQVGLYVLEERIEEPRVASLVEEIKVRVGRVLKPV